MRTFYQNIDGYWRDINKSGLPAHSGIYFVYRCTYNPLEKTVSLHQLIYIGEAENVNSRISCHERYDDWIKQLKFGETLCFSTTMVPSPDRCRVEAAYIFKHKPPLNTSCIYSFNYDTTRIISSGATWGLYPDFTVYRT